MNVRMLPVRRAKAASVMPARLQKLMFNVWMPVTCTKAASVIPA